VAVAPAKFQPNQVYRRNGRANVNSPSSPTVSGRLVSLGGLTPGALQQLTNSPTVGNTIIINFPSMPDALDLDRTANYYTLSTFTLPDGFHQYQSTDPLQIPFWFELHAFDTEYCPQGAVTLLDVAAKLHALTLPIAAQGQNRVLTRSAGNAFIPPGQTDNSESAQESRAFSSDRNFVKLTGGETTTSFPVACLLDLIYAGPDAPGVSCVGYVKDVKVRFKEPFLTPPGSKNKNLPTSARYSFTFIHRPNHTNKFNSNQTGVIVQDNVQAYADDVKNKLYNTVDLVARTTSYEGFKT
jgi:hypothetical protein